MDRWKSRGGKSQRGEEKQWEDRRGERVRRKKKQVRKKVGKSRFTVFFQWFVALEGRKVTSLKRRVRSHLARWEMKNCTPLSTSERPKVVRTLVFHTLLTWKCASRHNGAHFFDIWTSKSGPNLRFFALLTWKCASRHNGMHFFDISTSKSGLRMVCFIHFDLEMCFAPQQRALFRHLNFQKWSENGVFYTFWLGNVLRATTACTFSTSQLPKVVWEWCVLYILTWKCASRHNSVHFFDISTSKSGLRMVCFIHFDLEMCFAAQQRALFRHLNFQKWFEWSETDVFYTFWLGNILRATTACTFSTSQLPKVIWEWCVLYILTWKCASRHSVVQFFISHLASWLRTRRFSEVTFRPSRATNHWKNIVNRDFPTFSRTCIFSLLTFSLLDLLHLLSSPPWLFPPLLFHLSILSEVWLLNFLPQVQLHYITVHYTTLITLHYTTLHDATLHFTTLHFNYHYDINCKYTTYHYTHTHYTSYIQLHSTPLHYTQVHYSCTILHNTTLHYTTLNCATLCPQLQPQPQLRYFTLHYTRLDSTPLHYPALHYTGPLHLYKTTANTLHKLHHITTTTPLHYNYNCSCTTPHYIQQLWVRWPLQPLQPLRKTQPQPPFSPSVDSLCHPWITTTNLSYRFPILKLPPPPCAVLLVLYQLKLRISLNLAAPLGLQLPGRVRCPSCRTCDAWHQCPLQHVYIMKIS